MGTRLDWDSSLIYDTDHPHAYGDKLFRFLKKRTEKGSSPRVWGQERYGQYRDTRRGIIPTRMGTRNGNVIPAFANEDHPHAYGDKYCTPQNYRGFLGSSPRVWGQDRLFTDLGDSLRIIPTRMGTRGNIGKCWKL